ncbi:MAG: cytochrome c [Bacteroidetes bacterium]|nr:cytochrome c [Bacteroidota bacterium]
MNTNKKIITLKKLFFLLSTLYFVLSSCKSDPNSPGIEYMPDMYRGISYEANLENIVTGDTIATNLMPPKGSIARGFMPYAYGNDTAGYANSGRYLRNPIAASPEILAEGEILYSKYCVHCHGVEGKGDGAVSSKLPGAPPSYSGALASLPEGKIFHSITYGKGLMGQHASQLSQEERWKLVHYVQKLQKLGAPVATASAASSDTTKTTTDKK